MQSHCLRDASDFIHKPGLLLDESESQQRGAHGLNVYDANERKYQKQTFSSYQIYNQEHMIEALSNNLSSAAHGPSMNLDVQIQNYYFAVSDQTCSFCAEQSSDEQGTLLSSIVSESNFTNSNSCL